jgi:hypothetical protein
MNEFDLRYQSVHDGQVASKWELHALAQHYGLPTRFLDWSQVPAVALHFATEDIAEYDRDGVVWVVDYACVHAHLPPVLAELLQDPQRPFRFEDLSEVAAEPSVLAGYEINDRPLAVFCQNPFNDRRIGAQMAVFSVMSSAEASIEDGGPELESCIRAIRIPAELKREVRKRLDHNEQAEAAFFPDLAGVCRQLRRQADMRRLGYSEPL